MTVSVQTIGGSRAGRRILRIALALFAVRAVMPVGFMPAALADGGPVTLCHGASAATLALIEASRAPQTGVHDAGLHRHGSGHRDRAPAPEPVDDEHSELWDRCPLGAGSADVPLEVRVQFEFAAQPEPPIRVEQAVERPARTLRPYRARGPPVRSPQ